MVLGGSGAIWVLLTCPVLRRACYSKHLGKEAERKGEKQQLDMGNLLPLTRSQLPWENETRVSPARMAMAFFKVTPGPVKMGGNVPWRQRTRLLSVPLHPLQIFTAETPACGAWQQECPLDPNPAGERQGHRRLGADLHAGGNPDGAHVPPPSH